MSNYEYKLSVVVIVYNTEPYLNECLNSLVNQTLNDIEIICVNDESTDNSLNILKKFAKKYNNITIINQKNQGGAIAGNNGLKMAKGEYVTLIDSDDIVPHDAYEKLYKKAKETDSDIVGGRPNIYLDGYLREISYKHNIWLKEKTIDPNKNFEIYHDVFYWDKIYKRELIEKNDIYMIPGKLYADAPLVFKAYFYAKKITLIPDVVYYWRKRLVNTSITKSLLDIENMHDRLVTYYYLKNYFKEAKKHDIINDFIKIYFERFFYPIDGILMDENFEKEYLNELKNILEDIPNIYDNDLKLKYNLFTYFILNNQIDVLKEFLLFYINDRNILKLNDKYYWNLKYFRNSDYNVPDSLFEINYIDDNFIDIENINVDSEYIYIKNIKIPGNVNIKKVELFLMGLTKKYSKKSLNNYKFDLIKDSNKSNLYNGKIKISEIKNVNLFDVYLYINYDDKEELFRIKELNFPNNIKKDLKNKKAEFYFTKLGNFSMKNYYCENLFEIKADEESMKLIPLNNGEINYKIFINYNKKSNRVFFVRNKNELDIPINELELKWEYSLDKHKEYKLYIQLGKHNSLLTAEYIKNFKERIINTEIGKIMLTKNKKDEILIKLK